MLYMDLSVNNVVVFQGQVCPGQTLLRGDVYLGVTGALMLVDTQGWVDPTWADLGTRFILAYFSAQPPQIIPLQATPVQNLVVVLGGQNCVIGLYDQSAPTAQPSGSAMPTGVGEGYARQAFLAPLLAYVVPGYWSNYSV